MRQFLLLGLSPVMENFSSVSTTPCSLHPYHQEIITNLFSCYPGNPLLHCYHIHPLFYCAYSVLVTKQRTKCTRNYHCSCCVSCLRHMTVHLPSSHPQVTQLVQDDNSNSCHWQDWDNDVRKGSTWTHIGSSPLLSPTSVGSLLLWRFASCLFSAIRCWHTS